LMNQTSVTSAQTQKAASFTLAPGLQRHASAAFSAAEILSKVEVGQMGQKYSSEAVSIAEIAASGGLTEEKRQEITKSLMEKHTLECAQLENELRSNEIKIISEVITAYEEKKGKAVAELRVKIRRYIRNINILFKYSTYGSQNQQYDLRYLQLAEILYKKNKVKLREEVSVT